MRLTGLGILCLACGGEAPDAVPLVTDSAGIRIVYNSADLIATVPTWTLEQPAALSLGVVEGDLAQQFNQITAAYRLADGRVVVADGGRAGSREIRFFDATGNLTARAGGTGEGPGEFGRLHSLDRFGPDSLVASDWPVGDLSWFSTDGTFGEQSRIGPYWPGMTGRVLPDGTLLTEIYPRRSYGNEIEGWAAFGTEERFRPSGHLLRVSRDGETVDTLGPLVGEEWFRTGQIRVNLILHPLPFARTTAVAWTDDTIYLGDTHESEMRRLTYGGVTAGLVRWDGPRVPVSAADRAAFADSVMDAARVGREADTRRWLAEVPYPERKQAFTSIMSDDAGNVWVQLAVASGEDGAWLVFDAGGTAVASVSGPANLTVHSIADGYMVTSWHDELEVPYVRVYRIGHV